MTNQTGKLSLLTKTGYGLGAFCRNVENFFGVYMILYLTTIVGIAPGVAGTIFSVALTVGAFTTVIIGYKSDNSSSSRGKRRPYMIAFLIPLCISMLLFFMKWDISGNIQIAYYAIIAIVIYLTFNGFLIPYESLGAELTEDYTDRSNLRTINTTVIWISIFITGSLTISIVDAMIARGNSDSNAWMVAGLLVVATLLIGCLISVLVTKGKEPVAAQPVEKEKDGGIAHIFKTYIHVLKARQTRLLILWDFIFFVGQTMMVSGQSYFYLFVLDLGNSGMALVMGLGTIFSIIGTAFANILSAKTSKKNALVFAVILMIAGAIISKIMLGTGISSLALGMMFAFFFFFSYGMILMLCFAMIYDSAEINEYKFGDSMIAATVGVFVFVMTIAVAVGNWLIGFVLQIGGFDGTAAVQPDTVINMISNTETIIPSIIIFVSLLLLLGYKVNKKNHAAISEALEAKKKGEKVSEEGFKEIL